MKFSRIPLVVEAEQWFPGKDVAGVCLNPHSRDAFPPHIHTLEGEMIVSSGSWVITGIKGEKWAIREDIFKETYEPYSPEDKKS